MELAALDDPESVAEALLDVPDVVLPVEPVPAEPVPAAPVAVLPAMPVPEPAPPVPAAADDESVVPLDGVPPAGVVVVAEDDDAAGGGVTTVVVDDDAGGAVVVAGGESWRCWHAPSASATLAAAAVTMKRFIAFLLRGRVGPGGRDGSEHDWCHAARVSSRWPKRAIAR